MSECEQKTVDRHLERVPLKQTADYRANSDVVRLKRDYMENLDGHEGINYELCHGSAGYPYSLDATALANERKTAGDGRYCVHE